VGQGGYLNRGVWLQSSPPAIVAKVWSCYDMDHLPEIHTTHNYELHIFKDLCLNRFVYMEYSHTN
jgi:hypothetical protein